jgi:hypothetical protein
MAAAMSLHDMDEDIQRLQRRQLARDLATANLHQQISIDAYYHSTRISLPLWYLSTTSGVSSNGSYVCIFKIDFEKAYDKINWSFLQQAMRMKGFDPKWCDWV